MKSVVCWLRAQFLETGRMYLNTNPITHQLYDFGVYLASLWLSFLMYKMRIIVLISSSASYRPWH